MRRVAERVLMGGHSVPEETILRRHERGLRNFFSLYQGLTTEWFLYDNSRGLAPIAIAWGSGTSIDEIAAPALWNEIRGKYAGS